MRGEKRICRVPATKMLGSPPHARGKGGAETERGRSGGITPACAGKRQNNPYTGRPIRDHPRMRGEKRRGRKCRDCDGGSPPHARGKVIACLVSLKAFGITPACAGKSTRSRPGIGWCRDHPRMRGEKRVYFTPEELKSGSPPHARGKGRKDRLDVFVFGITPACAGKSK